MGSFKLKLVTWFALLALLPLAVAFYGYDSLTRRSETARTDAALDAGLRGVVAGYSARLDAATAKARQVARDPALQLAFRQQDRRALAKAAAGHPGAVAQFGPARPGSVAIADNGRVVGSRLGAGSRRHAVAEQTRRRAHVVERARRCARREDRRRPRSRWTACARSGPRRTRPRRGR